MVSQLAEKIETETLKPLVFDDATPVAVDNGYADQKICFWAEDGGGNRYIAELSSPSRAQMGAINISIDGEDSSGVYDVDGQAWTVSSDVQDPEQIRSKRYATSEVNAVLVNHSLNLAKMAKVEVRLSTGLPFSHFFNTDGAKDSDFIDEITESLKVKVKPRNGDGANIVRHEVYPESTAAWVDFSIGEEGKMSRSNASGVAVVDIGGNTTDVTYINPNNTINKDSSGSRKIGVLDVRDKLKQLISSEFRIDRLTDIQVDSALRTGQCKIFGKSCDVSSLVDAAKKETAKKLMNFVQEKVGDASELDYVIFVGGGAAVLGEIIKTYRNSVVPDRPEFANARGMLKYMTFVDND